MRLVMILNRNDKEEDGIDELMSSILRSMFHPSERMRCGTPQKIALEKKRKFERQAASSEEQESNTLFPLSKE